jgi:hypothetical protein
MKYKYRHLFRWLLIVLLVATGGCLLFQGCSKQAPTEPSSSTVITGTGSITVSKTNDMDDYTFSSGGYPYGKMRLVSSFDSTLSFQANGIVQGNGTTAPENITTTSSAVVNGYSYFLKTDAIPHYGKVTVTVINENNTAHTYTVQFQWVVQTEAGNRSLQ